MSLTVKMISSLEKVFSTQKELPLALDSLSLLNGEKGNLQLAVYSDEKIEAQLEVSCGLPFDLFEVKEIYSDFPIPEDAQNCTLVNGGEKGYYPDLLVPSTGDISLEGGKMYCFWLQLHTRGQQAGCYTLEVTLKDKKASLKINLSETPLPKQELIHTNWFHADCLATYYKTEVFSEEHWRITENFMKNAGENGVNCLLTPLFTPPLDTEVGGERPTVQLVDVYKKGYTYTFGFEKLDRWVDTALKFGIEYFELSHLFTQWGAKCAPKIMAHTSKGYRKIFGWETNSMSQGYKSFLRQFSAALKEYTDKKGITNICFVHCSDEPGLSHLARYKRASDIIREYFGAYEHIDALSDFAFYKLGLTQTPVPEEGNIDAFTGKVPSLWTYYCCGQYHNELPNRFFSMPSLRNRILGVLLYKYNCTGFLHWGFNFYYSQYSKREIDPFTETDAGGAFSSGDSFVVYPGQDGTPLSSLRQFVFADGIRDISVLKALENKTSREYVLNFIRENLGDIDFRHYPMDASTFLKFRENLCKEIEN